MRTREANAAARLCCIAESENADGLPTLEVPILASQNLCVSYRRRPVVDAVSLPFNRNRIAAIVGPSGSGKSTYLQCLNRMHELIEGCTATGDICFDGSSVFARDIDLVSLRLQVGMIFQRPTTFPLSIRRNLSIAIEEHLGLSRSEVEHRVVNSLERVGLWNEVADRLDTPAHALSGGQQQRLCLARALALNPMVLLLDEPCSALDPLSSGLIEDLLVELKASTTIVIVTHNLAQARRIADNVAVFWQTGGLGRLIEHGTAAQIFDDPRHELTAAYVEGRRG